MSQSACVWVVMEATSGDRDFWAWCLSRGWSGFDWIGYTETGGAEPLDLVAHPFRDGTVIKLGKMLFTVPAATYNGDRVHGVDDRGNAEAAE